MSDMVVCPKCGYTFSDKLVCKRCGHKWKPRSDKLPIVCPNPKCKSPYWNKLRKKNKNKKEKK